jgi:hypothetical protein
VDLSVPQCRPILGNGHNLTLPGQGTPRTFYTPRHGPFFMAGRDVFRVRANAAEPSPEHLAEIRRRAGLEETPAAEASWWEFLQTSCKLNAQGIRCRWVDSVRDGFQEVLLTDDYAGDARLLAGLPKSPPVRQLLANDCGLDDEGLQHLARHRELRLVHIAHTRVTAAGLAHLADLKQLQELHLIGDQFDDAALARLPPLAGLRDLVVSGKGLTREGLARWQQASPGTPRICWYVDR